eukprot:733514-Amorphochlora_amoeboformis.AAC.2
MPQLLRSTEGDIKNIQSPVAIDVKRLDVFDDPGYNQGWLERPPRAVSSAISADGSMAFSSSECRCILWDLKRKKAIKILELHRIVVVSVAMSEDGSVGMSTSEDGIAVMWNLRLIAVDSGDVFPPRLASPTSRISRGTSDAKESSSLFNRLYYRELKLFVGFGGDPRFATSCSLSKDGSRALTVCGNVAALWDVSRGTKLKSISCDHDLVYWGCSLSPGVKWALLVGQETSLWNLEDKEGEDWD